MYVTVFSRVKIDYFSFIDIYFKFIKCVPFFIFVIILSMVYFNFSLFSLVNVIAVSSAYTISFTCWLLLNNNDRSLLNKINK